MISWRFGFTGMIYSNVLGLMAVLPAFRSWLASLIGWTGEGVPARVRGGRLGVGEGGDVGHLRNRSVRAPLREDKQALTEPIARLSQGDDLQFLALAELIRMQPSGRADESDEPRLLTFREGSGQQVEVERAVARQQTGLT